MRAQRQSIREFVSDLFVVVIFLFINSITKSINAFSLFLVAMFNDCTSINTTWLWLGPFPLLFPQVFWLLAFITMATTCYASAREPRWSKRVDRGLRRACPQVDSSGRSTVSLWEPHEKSGKITRFLRPSTWMPVIWDFVEEWSENKQRQTCNSMQRVDKVLGSLSLSIRPGNDLPYYAMCLHQKEACCLDVNIAGMRVSWCNEC